MIIYTGMMVVALSVEDRASVIEGAQQFQLDFDDAYRYITAEKYNLMLVSFDRDFDRTTWGRKSPVEV